MNSFGKKNLVNETVLGDPCSSYQLSKNCWDYCKPYIDGLICYCQDPSSEPMDGGCKFPKVEPTHKPTYKQIHKPIHKPTHKPTHKPDIHHNDKVCINQTIFNDLLNLALKNCN